MPRVWCLLLSLALPSSLSFSLLTTYTDTMCGTTFTDRCPHLSKVTPSSLPTLTPLLPENCLRWRPLCPALPSPRRPEPHVQEVQPRPLLLLQDHRQSAAGPAPGLSTTLLTLLWRQPGEREVAGDGGPLCPQQQAPPQILRPHLRHRPHLQEPLHPLHQTPS